MKFNLQPKGWQCSVVVYECEM